MLQIAGDLEDLEQILGKPEGLRRRLMGSGSCSAFIKPIASGKDLLFSHVTWSTYQSMLRVQKLYSLPYKHPDGKNGNGTVNYCSRLGDEIWFCLGSTIVAGAKMSFSSYPGVLWSIDDFYVISSGLVSDRLTMSTFKFVHFDFDLINSGRDGNDNCQLQLDLVERGEDERLSADLVESFDG